MKKEYIKPKLQNKGNLFNQISNKFKRLFENNFKKSYIKPKLIKEDLVLNIVKIEAIVKIP
jgi:phosphoribosylaminoimidazole-succinocarboxamide synthase